MKDKIRSGAQLAEATEQSAKFLNNKHPVTLITAECFAKGP